MSGAFDSHRTSRPRTLGLAVLLATSAWLAGCATPERPVRATPYDFGPLPASTAPAADAPSALPPLILTEVEAGGSFDASAIYYRLGYADVNQLRAYSLARWSAPPAQLIRQRLREQLGRERAVLDLNDAATLARRGGELPRVLRVELEEFTHYFESEAKSQGLLRLRCTLLENTTAGERLVAQRTFDLRQPAATADAPGGVRALAAATDAAAAAIAQWLRPLR
jgi:cholesterol transport system auxiliary component